LTLAPQVAVFSSAASQALARHCNCASLTSSALWHTNCLVQ